MARRLLLALCALCLERGAALHARLPSTRSGHPPTKLSASAIEGAAAKSAYAVAKETQVPATAPPGLLACRETPITKATIDNVYGYGGDDEVVQPDRRAIVVLHGLLGSKRNFRSWAAQLSRALSHKRRIFCLDLRAHGDSFGGAAGMGYEAMAADVERTLDGLGLADCAVLGHSMGGKVAMRLALRDPARVRELCVLDIAPTTYSTVDCASWRQNRELIDALHGLPLADLADKRGPRTTRSRRPSPTRPCGASR